MLTTNEFPWIVQTVCEELAFARQQKNSKQYKLMLL